ncbi:type VII secretion target [Haloechinothrix sp. LS1_15]|uniref:type VII secretion target n=1 Tax=Haloechinothrix sp. LS1_15 TaxID=2652248 RepID=UPI002944897F|nr:type VII secretion target [Haloechinothrix sp. LS1_15]MDV6011183.1 PE domain-containing protein [Haloechinothrix sp. LS1_15]
MHEDAADAAIPPGAHATTIEVEPDQLLEAASIIEEQMHALDSAVYEAEGVVRLAPPAGDIVSEHATQAWNDLVADLGHSHLARVREYVKELHGFAYQLRRAAEEYRKVDEQAASALGDRSGPC